MDPKYLGETVPLFPYRLSRFLSPLYDSPGGRASQVKPQAGHEDEENFCGRAVRHHQPGGYQSLLRTVQRSQGVHAGI